MDDLAALSTRQLLILYGSILKELLRRDVVRTRNSPIGDYAEHLVKLAFGGQLEPNSNASWDVTTALGEHIQVKCRVVGSTTHRSATFSAFRSYAFDFCVFVILNEGTYEVASAVSIPAGSVEGKARFSKHVAGASIRIGTDLLALDGATDITERLRAAAQDD
jgi:hypothetical protein